MISEAKGCSSEGEKKRAELVKLRHSYAMPKLHFAAPGATCTFSWPSAPATVSGQGFVRCLPSLFTTAAGMTKLAHIRTVWGNPARRRFLLHTRN